MQARWGIEEFVCYGHVGLHVQASRMFQPSESAKSPLCKTRHFWPWQQPHHGSPRNNWMTSTHGWMRWRTVVKQKIGFSTFRKMIFVMWCWTSWGAKSMVLGCLGEGELFPGFKVVWMEKVIRRCNDRSCLRLTHSFTNWRSWYSLIYDSSIFVDFEKIRPLPIEWLHEWFLSRCLLHAPGTHMDLQKSALDL